jgi:hypothetical protein
MNSSGTKWLGRKTWRRLLELHSAGKISREQFTRLKDTLARDRSRADPSPPPPLRVVRGEGGESRPRVRYLLPASKEVA